MLLSKVLLEDNSICSKYSCFAMKALSLASFCSQAGISQGKIYNAYHC